MLKKLLSVLSIAAIVVSINGVPKPASAALVALDDLESGNLIRGETFAAVYYYGEDGFRYTFPNDKTYFTWYENFDDVKWISDADLGKIQIGGNVTYKPGVKMIKINSDPKTYAVDKGGTIRWVTSEEVAIALYGTDWNTKIDDVPDGFFPNYTTGADIESADDFDPAAAEADVEDINDDKDLQAPYVVSITDNSYNMDAVVTIEAGTAVKFVNNGSNKHTATGDDLTWGTGTLNAGDTFTRYFDEVGEFEFFCSYHPTMMTATFVVE
jgi:plastocyanin